MDYHPTMIILISITEYQLARLQGYNQVNIYISIYLYLYLYIYISIDRSQKETHCFLKQTKLSIFSFIKLENRRTKLVLPVALVVVGKGCMMVDMVQILCTIYVNGEMRPIN
jgi:hypothetical protein